MKLDKILVLSICLMASGLCYAEHDDTTTRDAAIGGGLGGAAGGAIGAEIGGRDGAILGSAAGAALGAAIATEGSEDRHSGPVIYAPYYAPPRRDGHRHYRHCPPGQAKKGRC